MRTPMLSPQRFLSLIVLVLTCSTLIAADQRPNVIVIMPDDQGYGERKTTNWVRVEWNATTPASTAVSLRVRSGDEQATLGDWYGPWDSSPALLDASPIGPVLPMPARYLQVEFELSTLDQEATPILHDFTVTWDCSGPGVQ